MKSEEKNCASYNCSIRNSKEGIRSDPSVAPRSPVGSRATDHTNKHYTQLSVSAAGKRFDLFLRPGLTRRPSPGN